MIRADRRAQIDAALREEIRQLAASIEGVGLEWAKDFEGARDEGGFRDFAPVAAISAADVRILEALVEELLVEFGYKIDVGPS